MSVQQTLANALDPTAIQAVAVPDVWPPPDGSLAARVPDASAGRHPGAGRARPAGRAGDGQPWPQRFAVLLAEGLANVRPARQLQPWLSVRGNVQLRRLQPLFRDGHRPRVQRVLTTQPAPGVIEMTVVVATGPRTRALAIRLERTGKAPGQHNWVCTDIEAA